MCGSGQASFWRENVIAVVIRLRVQMLKFLSFCDRDNKKQKQKTTTTKNSIEPFRVVPQSVESKLGRTGGGEKAERETGASPRLLVFFFARFARFPCSRDHPEGLLAVYIFRRLIFASD